MFVANILSWIALLIIVLSVSYVIYYIVDKHKNK